MDPAVSSHLVTTPLLTLETSIVRLILHDSAAAKVQLLTPAVAWSFEWCWQVVGMLDDEELTNVSGSHVYYPLLKAATDPCVSSCCMSEWLSG